MTVTLNRLLSGLFCLAALMAQGQSIKNSIGMEFVEIKPGRMVVAKYQPISTRYGFIEKYIQNGQDPGIPTLSASAYAYADSVFKKQSTPGFEVVIAKSYYIGKFEVTQEQWKQVMGTNPSRFQGTLVKGTADHHPVESITWDDAQRFLKRLTELEGGSVTYRLPTEFEWEYAARAGSVDDISWDQINKSAQIALTTTQPVGLKEPNAWGLYDMLGNVWEWTQDYYNEKMFPDPIPPRKGKEHVLKGAPFYGDVKNATYMTHGGGPGSGYDVGFRVVMERKSN